MVFVREARGQNKWQKLRSPHYPKFLVLDSNGYLHNFRYFDVTSSVPILPKFIKLLSRNEFLQNREFLKARLAPKRRSRGKSQDQKCVRTPPLITTEKKRSRSLMKRTLTRSEIQAL